MANRVPHTVICGEPLLGVIDGSNATFTLPDNFIPGTVDVAINGLTQRRTVDFTTVGTTTILMSESPLVGDYLTASYHKA